MKNQMWRSLLLFCLLILLLASVSAQAQQLAFPTAEGFGRFASGGRGGSVCKVTNLNNSGAGSLRTCLLQSATRTIMFDVAGTITLSSQITSMPGNLTIACHSAPGEGIMIKGAAMKFWGTRNLIMRYCRSRPGEPPAGTYNNVITLSDTVAGATNNIILDHVSVGWSNDDMIGANNLTAGVPYRVTVQNSILSEYLAGGGGSGGATIMYGDNDIHVSYLRNLFANISKRTPHVQAGSAQIVNNILHNVTSEAIYMLAKYDAILANIVNNWMNPSPLGGSQASNILTIGCGYAGYTCNATAEDNSDFYIHGNVHTVRRPDASLGSETAMLNTGGSPYPIQSTTPHAFPTISTQVAAASVKDAILPHVGASAPFRDAIDQRAVNDVQNNTGRRCGHTVTIASCLTYPTYDDGGGPPTDTDDDGMPDAWETACSSAVNTASTNHTGLSPSSAADGAAIVSSTGYSALEHYLNELAGDYESGSCGGLSTSSDTTDPTGVAITAPSAAATVSGAAVTFTATATDETAIDRVEFYQNDAFIASDMTSPYSINWNTTVLPDGIKTLHVIAYDTSGNSTQSADVQVTAQNAVNYGVVHVPTAPTIDGSLAEWAGANAINLSGQSNMTDLRFMWDATNLYLSAATTDTQLDATITTHDTADIWLDDSIELIIDTDHDGIREATDYKIMVNLQEATYDLRGSNDATWEPTYSVAVVPQGTLNDGANDTGWAIEMAIPWAEMGLSPAAEQVYGFNVQVNDDDASRTFYAWNGAINVYADARPTVLGAESGTADTTPVADYPFEGNGNDVVGGFNGAVTGSPTYPTAQVGTGIDLSGTGQYVTVTHNTALNMTAAGGTLTAWIRPDSLANIASGAGHVIAQKGNWNGDNHYGLTFFNTTLRCGMGKSFANSLSYAASNFSAGNWYHLACRAGPAGHALFVNGISVASNATAAVATTDTLNLTIGANSLTGTTGLFNGVIDELRIYGEPLSDEEIAALAGESDTTAPTDVVVGDPVDGQYIGGTYEINATAQDETAIADVKFYEGANLLCTVAPTQQSPFRCNWDTTQVTDGGYTLKVTACDTSENCVDSAVINVTVDSTDPSTPQNLVLTPGYDDGEYTIFANWDDSTDASGSLTYSIERCQGLACEALAEIDTSFLSDYSDTLVDKHSTYCYQVRAIDAAQNISAYSDVQCARTLSVIEPLPTITGLTDTANDTVSFPPPATGLTGP